MASQRDGGIAWCDETWNPIRGCTRVSEGCRHCYAEAMAARYSDPGQWGHGFAKRTKAGPRWTNEVGFFPEKLGDPLRWKKPRRIFVNSMSDLFHERLSDEQIDRVFGVMAATGRHVFQVLTKRPDRMLAYVSGLGCRAGYDRLEAAARTVGHTLRFEDIPLVSWPLPNVWLGVSCENQETADERITLLLEAPAAIRWVSAEPLLGPIDLRPWLQPKFFQNERSPSGLGLNPDAYMNSHHAHALAWVVVGGESGRERRDCEPAWIDSIVEQCRDAAVPCFVKQDSALRSGERGRLSDATWAVKEWPS